MLTLINTAAYADLSIGQIWARELDEGRYLCSASSMYRIARGAGQSRERRRLATHPAKVKPELLADGPSQVWNLGYNEAAWLLRGFGRCAGCDSTLVTFSGYRCRSIDRHGERVCTRPANAAVGTRRLARRTRLA